MKHIPSLILLAASFFAAMSHAQDSKPVFTQHPLPDSGSPYGYISYLPPDYAEHDKHPLVIFLHGYGELGDGKSKLDSLGRHGPFKLIRKGSDTFAKASAVVVAPQGLKSDDWWKWDKLDAFLEHVLKTYKVDKDRIYLTGLSMGGGGTWMLANRHPKTFAALVPICGAAKPGNHEIKLGHLPIWAFHSIDDPRVGFYQSELWLDGLTGKGKLMADYPKTGTQSASYDGKKWIWTQGQHAPKGQYGITVYPDNKHDSWTRAYDDPKLWEWLFAQKR